jgi:hypothetical protein
MFKDLFKKQEIPESELEMNEQAKQFKSIFTWSNKRKLKSFIKEENLSRFKSGFWSYKTVDTIITQEYRLSYLLIEIPNNFRTLQNTYKPLAHLCPELYIPRGEVICSIEDSKKNYALIRTTIYKEWVRGDASATFRTYEKKVNIKNKTRIIDLIIEQIKRVIKEGYGAKQHKEYLKKHFKNLNKNKRK